MTGGRPPARARTGSPAMRFVLLIGVVSLFADMTHEGARGIVGPFLGTLGASAAVVAAVAGFGELIGYALRAPFGHLADRSGRYWLVTLAGYAVQMAVVPALALAGSWPVAALLIMAERAGRAIRNPPRDAMLAHAAQRLGSGWAFGVREALDALGGMAGPLAVAAAIALGASQRGAFALLAIPAALTLVVLSVARRRYPAPGSLEADAGADGPRRLPAEYWIYLAGMALVAAAYADFPLIALHFERHHVFAASVVPILYAVAMATEAVAALGLGRLFDRTGPRIVAGATVLTAVYAPLVFLGTAPVAVAGMVVWGVGIAAQESIVKATITGMAPARRRASAYGTFDTGFGVAWFAGSLALGLLYGLSPAALAITSAALQLAALPLLARVGFRYDPPRGDEARLNRRAG